MYSVTFLYLNFQGQTFCFAIDIKITQTANILGRFASTRAVHAVELLSSKLILTINLIVLRHYCQPTQQDVQS